MDERGAFEGFCRRSVLCGRTHITGAAERNRVRDRRPRNEVLLSTSSPMRCNAHSDKWVICQTLTANDHHFDDESSILLITVAKVMIIHWMIMLFMMVGMLI